MDVSKIIAELRAERALLDEVIGNLERLSGPASRRRPHTSLTAVGRPEDGQEGPAPTPDSAKAIKV